MYAFFFQSQFLRQTLVQPFQETADSHGNKHLSVNIVCAFSYLVSQVNTLYQVVVALLSLSLYSFCQTFLCIKNTRSTQTNEIIFLILYKKKKKKKKKEQQNNKIFVRIGSMTRLTYALRTTILHRGCLNVRGAIVYRTIFCPI